MSRKGTQVINSSTMAVLAILVAATLSGSALNLMDLHKITLEEDITKIVSNRVASGVYGLDSYSNGSLEMDLDSKYRVVPAEEGEAVNVSLDSSTEISSVVYELVGSQSDSSTYSISRFDVDSNVVFEEDISAEIICAEKGSNEIQISGGEC